MSKGRRRWESQLHREQPALPRPHCAPRPSLRGMTPSCWGIIICRFKCEAPLGTSSDPALGDMTAIWQPAAQSRWAGNYPSPMGNGRSEPVSVFLSGKKLWVNSKSSS